MDGKMVILRRLEELSACPSKRGTILADEEALYPALLMLIEGKDEAVDRCLNLLTQLSERADHAAILRKNVHLRSALGSLPAKELSEKQKLALGTLQARLESRPSSGGGNPLRQMQTSTDGVNVSGGAAKFVEPATRKRGMKFISQANRSKTITLRLGSLIDHATRAMLEERLLKVKGIVSIYMDSARSRSNLRVRHYVTIDMVASALAGLEYLNIEQVVKDEQGCERFQPLFAGDWDKENEDPACLDYLNESFGFSTKNIAQGSVVRTGQPGKKQNGWFSSVTSFLSESLYW